MTKKRKKINKEPKFKYGNIVGIKNIDSPLYGYVGKITGMEPNDPNGLAIEVTVLKIVEESGKHIVQKFHTWFYVDSLIKVNLNQLKDARWSS